jgi:hypothetical protein
MPSERRGERAAPRACWADGERSDGIETCVAAASQRRRSERESERKDLDDRNGRFIVEHELERYEHAVI